MAASNRGLLSENFQATQTRQVVDVVVHTGCTRAWAAQQNGRDGSSFGLGLKVLIEPHSLTQPWPLRGSLPPEPVLLYLFPPRLPLNPRGSDYFLANLSLPYFLLLSHVIPTRLWRRDRMFRNVSIQITDAVGHNKNAVFRRVAIVFIVNL
jgi:hypothetical protein